MKVFGAILYALIGLYLVLLVLFLVFPQKDKKALMKFNVISIFAFLAYAIIRLYVFPIKIKNYQALSNIRLYLSSGTLILILILCAVFDKKKEKSSSRSIAFAGICISLSFALSFIKIEFLGGSITLASALPLIIYSYVFGLRKGIIAGVIFGVLQFLQKPTIYQTMQVILDYPVAFGAIGLSGISKWQNKPLIKFIIGASLGLFARYVAHVISGYFVFYIFALEGWNPFWYSVVFNMNVLVDLVIVLFIGCLLFTNKSFIKIIERIN